MPVGRRAGDAEGRRDLPGRPVGHRQVPDLALMPQVVEGAQGLLDRRALVEVVHEVEVDPLGAEPLQRPLDGAGDGLFDEPGAIGFYTEDARVRVLWAEIEPLSGG